MSTATLHARSGGVSIAYEVVGDGDPLVLVHGLGYARWGWEPVVEPLADDFRVALLDNRGIGESDVPPGPYSARAMAEDVVAVLDAVGFERTHVVATSLGGMVAQELALGWPERVDRLVLTSTTPGGVDAYPIPAQTLRLLMAAPTMPWDKALRRFVENALAPATVAERPELVARIYERRLTNPLDLAGWQAQAAAGTTFDAYARVSEIKAPTLVLHGTDDNVVDVRNADLLAELIPGARVELLPGAGHLFYWEQPDWFVDRVRGFLHG